MSTPILVLFYFILILILFYFLFLFYCYWHCQFIFICILMFYLYFYSYFTVILLCILLRWNVGSRAWEFSGIPSQQSLAMEPKDLVEMFSIFSA